LPEDIKDKAEEVIRIVQITDTHLCAGSDAMMLGINPRDSFTDVVDLVRQQQKQIDCILCTGDISQDASVVAYQYFYEVISSFAAPQLWLPGNHDLPDNIVQAVGADNDCLSKVYSIGRWDIVMLDSSLRDHTHGSLSDTELAFLDEALSKSQDRGQNILVCVHHNPVPVQARWLQNVCLWNSEDLFKIIDKYEQVQGVLCGHVHQDLQIERKGVTVMATPSTCIQFHPDNEEFALDDINPGYRWLELAPGGEITSGVQRVENKHYDVDFTSSGY
jgi:3',5'-cyclic-AMP phosphodiesterase